MSLCKLFTIEIVTHCNGHVNVNHAARDVFIAAVIENESTFSREESYSRDINIDTTFGIKL